MEVKPIVIEDREFKLEQSDVGSRGWDLSIKKTTKHKDGSTTTDWKIFAYGISIVFAIETIISFRMSARRLLKQQNKPFTLQEFFEEYCKERKATLEKFNLISINLTEDLNNLKKELYGRGEGKGSNSASNN